MNKPIEPLVTVLTPVYNGERYLAECIDSVLAQTYQNWEYFILNNGSQDRTLEIATLYAAKDRRIRVLSNDSTLDVISNHNRAFGLMAADSKYLQDRVGRRLVAAAVPGANGVRRGGKSVCRYRWILPTERRRGRLVRLVHQVGPDPLSERRGSRAAGRTHIYARWPGCVWQPYLATVPVRSGAKSGSVLSQFDRGSRHQCLLPVSEPH